MKALSKISILIILFVLAVSSCSKMDPLKEKKFTSAEETQDKAMRLGIVGEDSEDDGITDPDHDEDHDKDKIVVIK